MLNEEVVRGDPNIDEWIIVRKIFSFGVRYLLQTRRMDATKPYYLTQRIYMSKYKAITVLEHARRTGVLSD
jgi:hypothetical protein